MISYILFLGIDFYILMFILWTQTQAIKAKERGNEFYKKKQFEEALKHYDEAISFDPTDMTFYNNKAGTWSIDSTLIVARAID